MDDTICGVRKERNRNLPKSDSMSLATQTRKERFNVLQRNHPEDIGNNLKSNVNVLPNIRAIFLSDDSTDYRNDSANQSATNQRQQVQQPKKQFNIESVKKKPIRILTRSASLSSQASTSSSKSSSSSSCDSNDCKNDELEPSRNDFHRNGNCRGILRLDAESMKLVTAKANKNRPKQRKQPLAPAEHAISNDDPIQALIEYLNVKLNKSRQSNHLDSNIATLRNRLIAQCEIVVLTNRDRRRQAVITIWQKCFYPFIAKYRSALDTADHRNNLALILVEAREYFHSLADRLRIVKDGDYINRFAFRSLLELYKQRDLLPAAQFEQAKTISDCLAMVYIYLGDIERYDAITMQAKPNFDIAKSFYMKSHLLAPEYGHASSQIATMFRYQRNSFEAIFYFIRRIAIETDYSIDGAEPQQQQQHKAMLTIIFDEIGRAHERSRAELRREYAKWISGSDPERERILGGNSRIDTYERIEYWISPQISPHADRHMISKCDMNRFYDLAEIVAHRKKSKLDFLNYYRDEKLSTAAAAAAAAAAGAQIRSRFVETFLAVHGMLNCRSGCDHFFDVANQMLLEFDFLLAADSQAVSTFFLIQLLIINSFTIENTRTNDDCAAKNSAQYSFTHTNAYFVMSAMMRLVLRRAEKLFAAFRLEHERLLKLPTISTDNCDYHNDDDDHCDNGVESIENHFELHKRKMYSKEVAQFFRLLPVIKVFLDWLRTTEPRFPSQKLCGFNWKLLGDGHGLENWRIALCRFATMLESQIDSYPIQFKKDENSELVSLPENRFLNGIAFLNRAIIVDRYVARPFSRIDLVHAYLRIVSIKEAVRCISSIYFDSEMKTIAPEDVLDADYLTMRQDDLKCDSSSDDDDDITSEDGEKLFETKIAQIGGEDSKRRILIRPRFVIFDTNCFINNFTAIRRYIDSSAFVVTIPLIVVHELEYIAARGERISASIIDNRNRSLVSVSKNCDDDEDEDGKEKINEKNEIYIKIGKKATKILRNLREVFARRDQRSVRAVTSKGSLLKCANYNEEFYNPDAFNNDDLVLYACSNLMQNLATIDERNSSGTSTMMTPAEMRRTLEQAGEYLAPQTNDEFIYRDVVLITDDQNLRLKALCFEIPVKRLRQFCRWTRTFAHD